MRNRVRLAEEEEEEATEATAVESTTTISREETLYED
jgi:hypothetical protein